MMASRRTELSCINAPGNLPANLPRSGALAASELSTQATCRCTAARRTASTEHFIRAALLIVLVEHLERLGRKATLEPNGRSRTPSDIRQGDPCPSRGRPGRHHV